MLRVKWNSTDDRMAGNKEFTVKS